MSVTSSCFAEGDQQWLGVLGNEVNFPIFIFDINLLSSCRTSWSREFYMPPIYVYRFLYATPPLTVAVSA